MVPKRSSSHFAYCLGKITHSSEFEICEKNLNPQIRFSSFLISSSQNRTLPPFYFQSQWELLEGCELGGCRSWPGCSLPQAFKPFKRWDDDERRTSKKLLSVRGMIRGPIPPHFTHDQDPDLGAWRAKQPTNNPFKDKTYHRHRHREGHNFGEPPRPKHQPVAGLLGRLGEVHGLGRAVRGRQQQQTPAEPIRRGSRQHDGWGHGCGGGGATGWIPQSPAGKNLLHPDVCSRKGIECIRKCCSRVGFYRCWQALLLTNLVRFQIPTNLPSIKHPQT